MKPTTLYLTTTGDNVLRVEADIDFRPPVTAAVTFRVYAADGVRLFSLDQIAFAKLCAMRETFEGECAAMVSHASRQASDA